MGPHFFSLTAVWTHGAAPDDAFLRSSNDISQMFFCWRKNKEETFQGTTSFIYLVRSRDDDGDGKKNGKKAIGLDQQNNNLARASGFFVHFFAVVGRLRREMTNF